MQLSAGHKPNRLPKRFPVGTTYVVEGSGGEHGAIARISRAMWSCRADNASISRTISAVISPVRPRLGRAAAARRAAIELQARVKSAASRAKKIMARAGTTRQRSPLMVRCRAKPPSPSPSITRRRTPVALAAGVHLFRGSAQIAAGCALFPAHDQIVAMDHRGPAGKAQDRIDVGGRAAPDLLRIFGVIGR